MEEDVQIGQTEEKSEETLTMSKGAMLDLKANLNSLVFILTDFLVIQSELMKILVAKKIVTEDEITTIHEATADKATMETAYKAVFGRYGQYFDKSQALFVQEAHKAECEGPSPEDKES